MRLLLVILLSLSTSLYGWPGSLAEHMEEQCHVVKGEHHEESLTDHEKEHHATPGHETHDARKDCEPEHCSDHCNLCQTATPVLVNLTPDDPNLRTPPQKEIALGDPEAPASISLRPDTPPPKA